MTYLESLVLRNPQIIRNSDNAKSSVTMQFLENLHVNAGMLNEKKKSGMILKLNHVERYGMTLKVMEGSGMILV